MADKHVWHIQVSEPSHVAAVSDAFLARLVSELENEQVTAIILRGAMLAEKEPCTAILI